METLVPAYGRDYGRAQDVRDDWNAGKDFLLVSCLGNVYTSKRDWKGQKVIIRYSKNRKVLVEQG